MEQDSPGPIHRETHMSNDLTRDRWRLLAAAVVLVLCGVLAVSLGSVAYAAFAVVLLLVLVWVSRVSRRWGFNLVVIAVLLLSLLSRPVVSTWVSLGESIVHVASEAGTSLVTVLRPGAGLGVLPDKVLQVLDLMHSHHLRDYRLSSGMNSDSLIYQRTVEAAWPIRIARLSHNLFLLRTESDVNSGCTLVDQRKDVVLEHCP